MKDLKEREEAVYQYFLETSALPWLEDKIKNNKDPELLVVEYLDKYKQPIRRRLVGDIRDVILIGNVYRKRYNSKIYVKLPLELFAQMVAANEFSDGLVFLLNEEKL